MGKKVNKKVATAKKQQKPPMDGGESASVSPRDTDGVRPISPMDTDNAESTSPMDTDDAEPTALMDIDGAMVMVPLVDENAATDDYGGQTGTQSNQFIVNSGQIIGKELNVTAFRKRFRLKFFSRL